MMLGLLIGLSMRTLRAGRDKMADRIERVPVA